MNLTDTQGFSTTRCAVCGNGSANCQNKLPAPAQTCKQLLDAGAAEATTQLAPKPTTAAAGPTNPNSKCAVTGGCKYTMTDKDTLATAASTKKICMC